MIKIIKKLGVLLDKKQKDFMIVLVLMMLVGALLETASVGIIIPVMKLVMDQNAVEDNETVNAIYTFVGSPGIKAFTVMIMLLLIVLFVVKNLFIYVQQKVLYRYI